MKILIIEDEPELAKSIAVYLREEGYSCDFAADYDEALEKIRACNYDCILLDIMLPGGNGLAIVEELKRLKKDAGTIIISAKNSLDDRIKGLHLGADDYISKPFYLSELSARIFSVIRRRQLGNVNIIEQNELKVDVLGKEVTIHDKPVLLTKKEFGLLLLLISNANRVLSKAALAEHISGAGVVDFDSYDHVYAHIKNLKKKLHDGGCGNYLRTIYGTGYKWEI